MAWPIKSNPDNCVNNRLRAGRSCIECYSEQSLDNTWHGSQACWNAGCLVLDISRLSDAERKQLNL